MKKYIIIALILIVVAAMSYFIFNSLKKVSHTYPPAKAPVLNATPIEFYGQVQPEGKIITLSPKTAGIIKQLNFIEGSHIVKGQLLIAFDDITEKKAYESSLSQVDYAKKVAEASNDSYSRSAILFKEEVQPQADYLQIKIKKEIDEEQVKVNQKNAETNFAKLQDRYLYAPQDGIIYKSDLHVGEAFSPTDIDRLQMGSSKLEIVGDLETYWIGKLNQDKAFQVFNAETDVLLGTATFKSASRFLRPKTTQTENTKEKTSAKYQEIILSFQPNVANMPIGLPVKVKAE